jgi:hypothetical protein
MHAGAALLRPSREARARQAGGLRASQLTYGADVLAGARGARGRWRVLSSSFYDDVLQLLEAQDTIETS